MPTSPGSRGSSGFGALVSVSWMRMARTGADATGTSPDPLDRRHRHRRDSLAATHEAHTLVRAELDRYLGAVEPHCAGQLDAHAVAIGREPRRLAQHGRVQ